MNSNAGASSRYEGIPTFKVGLPVIQSNSAAQRVKWQATLQGRLPNGSASSSRQIPPSSGVSSASVQSSVAPDKKQNGAGQESAQPVPPVGYGARYHQSANEISTDKHRADDYRNDGLPDPYDVPINYAYHSETLFDAYPDRSGSFDDEKNSNPYARDESESRSISGRDRFDPSPRNDSGKSAKSGGLSSNYTAHNFNGVNPAAYGFTVRDLNTDDYGSSQYGSGGYSSNTSHEYGSNSDAHGNDRNAYVNNDRKPGMQGKKNYASAGYESGSDGASLDSYRGSKQRYTYADRQESTSRFGYDDDYGSRNSHGYVDDYGSRNSHGYIDDYGSRNRGYSDDYGSKSSYNDDSGTNYGYSTSNKTKGYSDDYGYNDGYSSGTGYSSNGYYGGQRGLASSKPVAPGYETDSYMEYSEGASGSSRKASSSSHYAPSVYEGSYPGSSQISMPLHPNLKTGDAQSSGKAKGKAKTKRRKKKLVSGKPFVQPAWLPDVSIYDSGNGDALDYFSPISCEITERPMSRSCSFTRTEDSAGTKAGARPLQVFSPAQNQQELGRGS